MKNKSGSFDINNIQLKIQSPHVTINEELNDYIILQIEKLGKLFHRIERCEAMLLTRKNDQKDVCEMEVKIFVPGKVLFAKEHKVNFRLAAQFVFEDLYNQLYKFKDQLKEPGSEKLM
jgi:ribosomal subunit interface protein